MKKKLVVIGAGSAMFTQGLIADLLNQLPGGHTWAVALCDIVPETLKGIEFLVKKMAAAKNVCLDVTSSTNRCDLLPDADYVVSTIGVGGRRSWEQDVFIPRKYGIFQPVGDTAMPGGLSRAMRMVPAMIDIVNDVKKLAPSAMFFNYSNPMSIILRALAKTVDFPVTGLCMGTVGSQDYIADTMGYDRSCFTTLAAGINHCTFIYDFRYEGKCVKNEIRQKIETVYVDGFDSKMIDRFHGEKEIELMLSEPFSWFFFLNNGSFPAPGDRHVSEFFTEFFPGGAYYGKKLGVDAYPFEGVIAYGDAIHNKAMETAHSLDPLPGDFFTKFGGEHEQLIDIIDSIERDRRDVYYINNPNRGAIPGLPYDAVVEMPATATALGLMPLYMDTFPVELRSHTNRFLAGIELAAEAALRGDRRLLEEAILAGGYITDRGAVTKMTEELLTAQKTHLPQF